MGDYWFTAHAIADALGVDFSYGLAHVSIWALLSVFGTALACQGTPPVPRAVALLCDRSTMVCSEFIVHFDHEGKLATFRGLDPEDVTPQMLIERGKANSAEFGWEAETKGRVRTPLA